MWPHLICKVYPVLQSIPAEQKLVDVIPHAPELSFSIGKAYHP